MQNANRSCSLHFPCPSLPLPNENQAAKRRRTLRPLGEAREPEATEVRCPSDTKESTAPAHPHTSAGRPAGRPSLAPGAQLFPPADPRLCPQLLRRPRPLVSAVSPWVPSLQPWGPPLLYFLPPWLQNMRRSCLANFMKYLCCIYEVIITSSLLTPRFNYLRPCITSNETDPLIMSQGWDWGSKQLPSCPQELWVKESLWCFVIGLFG